MSGARIFRWLGFVVPSFALGVNAATKVVSTNESDVIELKPPHAELPPGFLEVHGLQVGAVALIVLSLLAWIIYSALKPRAMVPEAPVVIARRNLARLKNQEETGVLVMEVSITLKRYLNAVLGFMPGEKTTTEFSRALSNQSEVPQELAVELAGFLKRCDEWKFSPSPRPAKLNLVDDASLFIDRVEAGLAQKTNPQTAEAVK